MVKAFPHRARNSINIKAHWQPTTSEYRAARRRTMAHRARQQLLGRRYALPQQLQIQRAVERKTCALGLP